MKRSLFLLAMLALLMSVSVLLTAPAAASAATNDTPATAIAVNAFPYSNTQSTLNATDSTGDETIECSGTPFKTVWYDFTPASDGYLTISSLDSDFETRLALTGTNSICSNYNSGTNRGYLSFPADGGTTYTVAAYGASMAGNLVIAATLDAIPASVPNDTPTNATAVTTFPYTDTNITINATDTTGEPTPVACMGAEPTHNIIWYDVTPSAAGVLHVNTLGSDFNTAIFIVAPEACNTTGYDAEPTFVDDTILSKQEVAVTANTTYQIGVGGAGVDDVGKLTFNAELFAPTTNDTPATATTVMSLPYTQRQIVFGAVDTTDEVDFTCNDDDQNAVWFTLTAPATGIVYASTYGSEYDTVLQLAGSPDLCNDDTFFPAPGHWNYLVSGLSFEVTQGQQYTVGVAGYDADNFGILNFSMRYINAPANDTPDTATWFYNPPYRNGETNVQTVEQTTYGAVDTTGDSAIPCDVTQVDGEAGYWVWFNVWAPLSGTINLDTDYISPDGVPALTNYATRIYVEGAESCYGGSDTISATGGTVYQVAVGGNFMRAGNLSLTVEYTPDADGTPARTYPTVEQNVTDVSTGWPNFTFTHVDGVEWYRVWIGTSDLQKNYIYKWYPAVANAQDIGDATPICDAQTDLCTIPDDLWLVNGDYVWWMSFWAQDSTNFTQYWNATDFSVTVGDVGTITNRFPGNGSSFTLVPTELTWDHDPNALWYRIWLGSADYSTPVIGAQWFEAENICEAGTCTVPIEDTLADGDYAWFMQVWSPSGFDLWAVNGEELFSVAVGAAP